MAKAKKSAVQIGLYFYEKNDGDYTHFGLHPVVIGRTPTELKELDGGVGGGDVPSDRVRGVSCRYEWDTINGLDLDGLRIWSQGDKSNPRLYGWETEYHDVFSVDRGRATRMARTLNTIEKRMEKHRDKFGNTKTFGQYVASVAKAIGATKLVLVPNAATLRGWSWNDVDIHFRDFPREAIDHIDYLVDKWAESVRQKEAV